MMNVATFTARIGYVVGWDCILGEKGGDEDEVCRNG